MTPSVSSCRTTAMICCCDGFHFLDLDGAQGVHILAKHFGSALAHGLQHVVLHLLAGAFQRDGQNLAVHLGEHFLDGVDVQQQQVFEDEHQVADGFHQVGIHLFDIFQNFLGAVGIQAIEHFRDRVDASGRIRGSFRRGISVCEPITPAILAMISGEI